MQDLDSSLGKKVLEEKVTEEHYLLPAEAHHAAEPPLEEPTDCNLAEAVEGQRGSVPEEPKRNIELIVTEKKISSTRKRNEYSVQLERCTMELSRSRL